MSKPSYPTQNQSGQQMYQASDGNWYPTTSMPQNWQGQQQPPQPSYGGGYQQPYGQQQPMYAHQTQPVYVQDQRGAGGMGAGAGAGAGLCAGLCAGLLCFDLCLFC
ncbi:hypothetical protein B9479_007347 [Cryptococcus floricola]|uniref:Cysteine-rich transmembrane CYSTM domain-containing protein n=1 Tax=Cryptococcus floricola TaxID=2591691 RepID=A0A5D3AQS8_9TREE|nr:hypothetical protein B9479_007347 [Cryptococcus floricola]